MARLGSMKKRNKKRRKKGSGRLGKLLKTPRRCFAAPFRSGCSPKVSLEHPLSHSLREGRTLTLTIGDHGGPNTFEQTLGIEDLAAPILCISHNNELSPLDSEAKRFQTVLLEVQAIIRSGIVAPSIVRVIDGSLFGRWLCKFYCGMVAMQGKTPQPEFVRYAFGLPTDRRVYIYFPGALQDNMAPGDTSNMPLRTLTDGTEDQAFTVVFEGARFLVSLFPADAPEMSDVVKSFPPESVFLDRVKGLNFQGDGIKIQFDWSGDPDERSLVDVKGHPTGTR